MNVDRQLPAGSQPLGEVGGADTEAVGAQGRVAHHSHCCLHAGRVLQLHARAEGQGEGEGQGTPQR